MTEYEKIHTNSKNINSSKKSDKYNKLCGIALALAAIVSVFAVEQVIQPEYWIKSVFKVSAFLGAIFVYAVLTKQNLTEVIGLRKIEKIKPLIFCMILFFSGIVVSFFMFKTQIDLVNIKQSLINKENLTKENCLFVFLYIILCNSFLEESFFRGFVFKLFDNKIIGAWFGSVMFSLYHIGIFITWFNPLIFLISLTGLTVVGLILQWIAEKYNTILASYITHACANVAINMIGVLLIFEIIK